MKPAVLKNVPYDKETKIFEPVAAYQGTMEEYDYIDEEYFASGEDENGEPYTTWVRIRRPRDISKFSGTVIMEPLHFYAITPIFTYTSRYIMRSGHAWVGVGSPKTAIDGVIKPTNPERYAPLHIGAEPLSEEAKKLNYLVVAAFPDETGKFWWEQLNKQNHAANSILAQVGAAVKCGDGPFNKYNVKKVILGGHSYTCYVTTRFMREGHKTMLMDDGTSVYDGFFPSGWPSTSFEPMGVPVLQVVTEDDLSTVNKLPFRMLNSGMDYRREDSDTSEDSYRLYEFGGFGHTSTQYPPVNDIKFLEMMDPTLAMPDAVRSSSLPFCEMHQMALDHLVKWVAEDVCPPYGNRLEMACEGPGIFAKDVLGNTLGGVRCASLDVPHSSYYANRIREDGSVTMAGYGFEVPFDANLLKALYGTKATYMEKFKKRLNELLREGWFLAEDVDLLLQQAEKINLD